jgi:hypothetical protein
VATMCIPPADSLNPRSVPELHDDSNLLRLTHALCNPHLGPADFWLFGHVKSVLERGCIEALVDLEAEVVSMMRSIAMFTRMSDERQWQLEPH